MRQRLFVIAIVALTASMSAAIAAAAELIPGKIMIIKPGKIAKFVSKPRGGAFPLIADPTATGATLHIFDTGGAAGDVTYNLPATSWTGLGNPPGAKGYKYNGSGCGIVLITPRVIKAVCKESVSFTTPFSGPAGITLAVPSQATAAYCAQFGGDEKKNDLTLTKRKNAPAPTACAQLAANATATSTQTASGTGTPTGAAAGTSTFTPIAGTTNTRTRTTTATGTPAGTSAATGTPTGTAAATITPTRTSPPPPTSTPTITSLPSRTPTPTVTNTPTVPPICQPGLGLPPIGQVPVTLAQGSTQCGGAGLTSPPPAPPFSGAIANGSGATLADLSLGCLYTGNLPPLLLPYGSSAKLSVVGLSVLPLSLTLGGSPGTGPNDCTLAAGPGRKCANGAPGVDGSGTCNFDDDCGGSPTACALEPNCFFGPPIPVPNGALSACVMNAFLNDLCGQVNLVPPQATFAAALSSRVYLTFDAASPCPRCLSGVCSGGERAGLACSAGGSAGTSVDCPPTASQFLSVLTVVIPELTSGQSTITSSNGFFCSGQTVPGAIGLAAARRVTEQGAGPTLNLLGLSLSMNLAGTFCIEQTGTFLDPIAGLPAVGALSAAGQVDVSSVLLP